MTKIEMILAKASNSCLNSTHVARATRTYNYIAIMKILLVNDETSMIFKDTLVEGTKNSSDEMLELILVHEGKITQNVLLENASHTSVKNLNILL